jgi:predicted DNA-binding protein (MmcQ/YjbR family)
MNIEKLRKYCLKLKGATEQIQWGADLVFKVGGKMFAVAATEPDAGHRLSFKCTDEGFAELLEQEGIVPAPYMARAKWVALERWESLSDREIEDRIRTSYDLVFGKLTKAEQARISGVRQSKTKK